MSKSAIFDLLPTIFRDCVGVHPDYNAKYNLRYPQVVDGWIVATNGRILIRMPATPEIVAAAPDLGEKKFPTVEMVARQFAHKWESAPVATDWQSALDTLPRCKTCEATGHRPERACSCGPDTPVDEDELPCRGLGRIPAGECWDCEGTGIDDPREAGITFAENIHVAAYYLDALRRAGAALFLPVDPGSGKELTPLYFTIEGDGEGVVQRLLRNEKQQMASAEETRS